MTYNIEIFKSESYQKILKEVLKFRYPDLSYEKALKIEFKHFNCFFKYNEIIDYVGYNAKNYILHRKGYDGMVSEYALSLSFNDKRKLFSSIETMEILGRPITICEIVDVLNDVDKKYLQYYYSDNALYKWDEFMGDGLYKLDPFYTPFSQNTYYLHEQTQETIDKIAKLLF